MKKVLLTIMVIGVLALTACSKSEEAKKTEVTTEEFKGVYEGKYLDYDNNEPNLKISVNVDGTYTVHIGIFRLAVFDSDDAMLTDAGLEFTAEDGAGNPIKGVITLEGNEAVVTFTDSTWSLIENGTAYRYHR